MTSMSVGGGTKESRSPAAAGGASRRLFVCAECRYARLFAVEPRVLCTRPGGHAEGEVLFAGRPACHEGIPREPDDADNPDSGTAGKPV